jgi:Fe-S-cluster containining protein
MPKQADVRTMIEEMREDQITSMNNPDCISCNECCSMGSMLTDEEYAKLKRFLKKDKRGRMIFDRGQALIRDHLKKGVIYWLCPFSKNYRCTIYNTRPSICRTFHCDEPEMSKEYRDSYRKESKTIGTLFSIMEIIKQDRKG